MEDLKVLKNNVKSVYIHIPFCKSICSYCDFCKFYYKKEWIDSYLDSLSKEIDDNYKGELLDTIYIGGGTPSSLNIEELNRLFSITNKLLLNDNYEFTIEFNIEDISIDKLELCKMNKVNRISIGVESFNKNNLDFLERKNDVDIKEKVLLTKEYFENINIDLIYALPNESLDILEKDLDLLLELDVPHLSCYSLIIEKHTKLFNKKIRNISEEIDRDMYDLINKKLKDYNHYEISNYSKKGYESRHNLNYWNNEEYYGFGVGASGYIDGIRYTNSRSITSYLKKIYTKDEEFINKEECMSYELILGFRKLRGINIIDFNNKYKVDIITLYNIKELINKKILEIKDNYLFINDDYIYISNEILINFI